MSGGFIVRHGQIVAAHAVGRSLKLSVQLLRQKELREVIAQRAASAAAAKAWNADMAARKAAKGGKA